MSWKTLDDMDFAGKVALVRVDINVPVEAVLRRFQSTAAQVGMTLRIPLSFPYDGLKKQDRERAAAFKVKNWPEFSRALSQMGIEKRAFGYPI